MGSHTFATNKHIHHTLLPHSSQMLRILALAAGVKAADWAGTNINVTTSWESNDDTSAGGIVTFESPADAIANGTGSCTVTISSRTQFRALFQRPRRPLRRRRYLRAFCSRR